MNKKIDQQTLIDDLRSSRAEILNMVSLMPEELRSQVYLGDWSAYELLAHLIGWDHTNIQAAEELMEGKLPGFYAFHDRDWRNYNARLVAQYRRSNIIELLADCQESHATLLTMIGKLPEVELDRDRGVRFRGWRVTIARLLLAEARDERQHAQQLQAFIRG